MKAIFGRIKLVRPVIGFQIQLFKGVSNILNTYDQHYKMNHQNVRTIECLYRIQV